MLDPLNRRRHDFGPGHPLSLADGQLWALPDPAPGVETADGDYEDLLVAIVEADQPDDLLRAELALAIHLLAANYDLPPLILGALLDFPHDDPGLAVFQRDLHALATVHTLAYRRPDGSPADPRFIRRFRLFRAPWPRLTA